MINAAVSVNSVAIDFNEDNRPHLAHIAYAGEPGLPKTFAFDGNKVAIEDPDGNPMLTLSVTGAWE